MIIIITIIIVSLYGLLQLLQMIKHTPLRNIDEDGYLHSEHEDEMLL